MVWLELCRRDPGGDRIPRLLSDFKLHRPLGLLLHNDFSVLYKTVLSVLVLALWLRAWTDAAVILLASGVVLAAEFFNTAIEALCDFVETRHNEKIGIIKDVAAAATGVGILAWAIVFAVEVLELRPRLAAMRAG